MRSISIVILIVIVLLSGSIFSSETEDWHIYMDASAINRISCVGDSLWCGTGGGVLLYNLRDSTFTNYVDGLGFNFSDVSSVVIDQRGSIWGGFTGGGVFRIDNPDLDPRVEKYTEVRSGLLSDSITCMVSAGEDVYYGSRSGVAKFYNNVHVNTEPVTDSLRSKKVYDMVVAGDSLWVACSQGVAYFNRSNFAFHLYRIGEVTSLCIWEGEVCCVSGEQVRVDDNGNWSTVGAFPYTPVAVSSGGGELFGISKNKVFRWGGSEWVEIYGYDIYDPRSLRAVIFKNYRIDRKSEQLDILRTIAVDSNGTPWVGGVVETQKRGAYISGAAGGAWFNESPGMLTQNEIIELSLDPQGGIWYSTRQFGVGYLAEDGKWFNYTEYRGDVEDDRGLSYFAYNFGFLMDSNRSLWLMSPHYGGDRDMDMVRVGVIDTKDDDQWRHYSPGDTITSDLFIKIKEDPNGNIWFLADEIGVINICSSDGNNWIYVDESDGLEAGKTFDCAFGEDGSVYLALRGYGVQVWNLDGYSWADLKSGGFFYTIMDSEDLTSTELHSIALGEDNTVWLGTASGLIIYRNNAIEDSLTIRTEVDEKGLVGSIAYDLEFDGEGNIWVASDGGLDKVNGEGEVVETYTSYSYWGERLRFIYSERVISPLISSVCKALEYDSANNIMWIGTDNGLACLDLTPAESEEIPLSRMILYPNPIHISRDNSLRISRISGNVDIEIYNLEGELVHQIYDVSEDDTVWELLTMNGYKVCSGVYLVRVIGKDGSSEFRKLAVIK